MSDDVQPQTTADPLYDWMCSVTHILDKLAEAAGLEADRADLVQHFNAVTDSAWTTEYVSNAE